MFMDEAEEGEEELDSEEVEVANPSSKKLN